MATSESSVTRTTIVTCNGSPDYITDFCKISNLTFGPPYVNMFRLLHVDVAADFVQYILIVSENRQVRSCKTYSVKPYA